MSCQRGYGLRQVLLQAVLLATLLAVGSATTYERRLPQAGHEWLPAASASSGVALYLPRAGQHGTARSGDVSLEFAGQIGGPTRGIDVVDDLIYRAQGPHLVVLDGSHPTWIHELGRTQALPGLVFDVAIDGDYAFLGAGAAGLAVVDVADPARPEVVAVHVLPGESREVEVAGGYAYVAAGHAGLHVVDVRAPAHPKRVGALDTPGYITRLAYADGFLYLVSRESSPVRVVDVRDPTEPSEVATLSTEHSNNSGTAVAVASGHAYVANGDRALEIWDVSDPAAPEVVALSYSVMGDLWLLEAGFDRLFAFVGELRVLDIGDPRRPVLMGSIDVPECIHDIAPARDHVVLATGYPCDCCPPGSAEPLLLESAQLLSVDLSEPFTPQIDGAYALGSLKPVGVYPVSDRHVYMHGYAENGTKRAVVADVSEPGRPRVVGELTGLTGLVDVAADGDTGYAIRHEIKSSQFHVLDLSDPVSPRTIGAARLAGERLWQLTIGDGRVYATSGSCGKWYRCLDTLHIFDVTDPAHPRAAGRLDLTDEQWFGMAVSGDYLYAVTAPDAALLIIDIGHPVQPRIAARLPLDGSAAGAHGGLVLRGQQVFAGGPGRLHVVDVAEPDRPRLVTTRAIEEGGRVGGDLGDYLYVLGSRITAYDISVPEAPSLAAEFEMPAYVRGARSPNLDFALDSLSIGAGGIQVTYQVVGNNSLPQGVMFVRLVRP